MTRSGASPPKRWPRLPVPPLERRYIGSYYAIAFQFLTTLPFCGVKEFSSREMARSMRAFPLVGLTLGAGLLSFHLIVGGGLPDALEGAILTGLLLWATGAFHVDGLADTVDGLAGGWTRGRTLEIMKDSNTGAVGAAAVSLAVVTKALALGLLPAEGITFGLLLTPEVARGSIVWLAYGSSYARAEPGLGSAYAEHLDSDSVTIALLSAGLPCLLLGWKGLFAFGAVILYATGSNGSFAGRWAELPGMF